MAKIGRGKYSDVFIGWSGSGKEKVVVKIIKPIRIEKINREVKVLRAVAGGPNIVNLLELVKSRERNSALGYIPSYIFEYIPRSLPITRYIRARKLTDTDTRIYLYKLLEALEYSHS